MYVYVCKYISIFHLFIYVYMYIYLYIYIYDSYNKTQSKCRKFHLCTLILILKKKSVQLRILSMF